MPLRLGYWRSSLPNSVGRRRLESLATSSPNWRTKRSQSIAKAGHSRSTQINCNDLLHDRAFPKSVQGSAEACPATSQKSIQVLLTKSLPSQFALQANPSPATGLLRS